MSFLSTLVERTLTAQPAVRPRLPSRYESRTLDGPQRAGEEDVRQTDEDGQVTALEPAKSKPARHVEYAQPLPASQAKVEDVDPQRAEMHEPGAVRDTVKAIEKQPTVQRDALDRTAESNVARAERSSRTAAPMQDRSSAPVPVARNERADTPRHALTTALRQPSDDVPTEPTDDARVSRPDPGTAHLHGEVGPTNAPAPREHRSYEVREARAKAAQRALQATLARAAEPAVMPRRGEPQVTGIATAPAPTTVHVTIGRVEIRAAAASAPRPRSEAKRAVSLADYLRKREERR